MNTRPSLRNGFTAYAVLSPETSSWLTPSPSVQLALLRQLDACNGRQDHTVLPYAQPTPSSQRKPASTAPRPTSVTTADALLTRTGWTDTSTDLAFWKSEIFLILGLDTNSVNRNLIDQRIDMSQSAVIARSTATKQSIPRLGAPWIASLRSHAQTLRVCCRQ